MSWVTGGFGRKGTSNVPYVSFGLGRWLEGVLGPWPWKSATTIWSIRYRTTEAIAINRVLEWSAQLRSTTSLARVRTTTAIVRKRVTTFIALVRRLLFLD